MKKMEKLPDEVVQILDNINIAIFIDDSKGYGQWLNKSAEELYEIKREDIIGKNMDQLEKEEIFTPSLTKKILEAQERTSIIHENRVGRKLLTSGVPLRDENNNIYRIVTFSVDITKLVQLENELQEVKSKLIELTEQKDFSSGGLMINSQVMHDLLSLSRRLADIDTTILITGESGTGKGVVAKYLHDNGNRKNYPFVRINCGAVPDNLLESEFFGYESGAFTGSRKEGKKGLFEVAQKGTIFLDEICELPLNMQVKILQVIQEKEIQKVGGLERQEIDVRIIAATNKNLEELVAQGKFREDLFYRLNIVPINIPPLRERPEDVLIMLRTFLKKNNEKFNLNKVMDSNASAILLKYNWPGNVRELENMMERLVLTTNGSVISPDSLPDYVYRKVNYPLFADVTKGMTLKDALELTEKKILSDAVTEYATTRHVAEALGINQSTVVRKLAKYKITPAGP